MKVAEFTSEPLLANSIETEEYLYDPTEEENYNDNAWKTKFLNR